MKSHCRRGADKSLSSSRHDNEYGCACKPAAVVWGWNHSLVCETTCMFGMFGPPLTELLCEGLEPLAGRAPMEEVGHWNLGRWTWMGILSLLTSGLTLLPHLPCCEHPPTHVSAENLSSLSLPFPASCMETPKLWIKINLSLLFLLGILL